MQLEYCSVVFNGVTGVAGGAYFWNSSGSVDVCNFTRNYATVGGGTENVHNLYNLHALV